MDWSTIALDAIESTKYTARCEQIRTRNVRVFLSTEAARRRRGLRKDLHIVDRLQAVVANVLPYPRQGLRDHGGYLGGGRQCGRSRFEGHERSEGANDREPVRVEEECRGVVAGALGGLVCFGRRDVNYLCVCESDFLRTSLCASPYIEERPPLSGLA